KKWGTVALSTPPRVAATVEWNTSEGPVGVLLQTWKAASQKCKSYGWEESFTSLSME
ncbi:hypothetical protein AVEN_145554-1, partial [Araneus ventricosus]